MNAIRVTSLFLALICLNTAAKGDAVHALSSTASSAVLGQAGGPAVKAAERNACENLASIGYQCCLYVRGGDGIACDRYRHEHHEWTRHGVATGIEIATELIGHGKTLLGSITTGYLIGHFATHRLDLTGIERMADGFTARCIAGESVPVGPRTTYVGTRGYSNPLYGFGRWNQAAVVAYVKDVRRQCSEYTAKLAIDELRRPLPSTADGRARCGTMVSQRMALHAGPTGGGETLRSIRQTRYCEAPRSFCCRLDNQWTDRAYCTQRDDAFAQANGLTRRVCVDASPPAARP